MKNCFEINAASYRTSQNFFRSDGSFKRRLNEKFSIPQNFVIDAEEVIDAWFPNESYDIFISYSHDDEALAMGIASTLEEKLKLKVFVDGLFWGSANDLIEKLQKNKELYLQDVLLAADHVHSMLASSILNVMKSSHVVFFINTKHSEFRFKNTSKTLSPWIFLERTFAKAMCPQKLLDRQKILNEASAYKVVYTSPTSADWKHVSLKQLEDWCELCEKSGIIKNNALSEWEKI